MLSVKDGAQGNKDYSRKQIALMHLCHKKEGTELNQEGEVGKGIQARSALDKAEEGKGQTQKEKDVSPPKIAQTHKGQAVLLNLPTQERPEVEGISRAIGIIFDAS